MLMHANDRRIDHLHSSIMAAGQCAANLGHAGAMTRLTTLQTTSAMRDILKRAIAIISQ
jgi:hypothetical protein